MSATIDERVVSMQFDNRHFENNVKTSMSTLDKLKQSLNMNGAAKGLQNVDQAAKKIDFTGLGTAIDTVQSRFSTMGVVATTALVNIANQAVNTGQRMLSALTIDPITTGFSEYETKIGSVQTILANTASKGSTMDDVTQVLNELNEYADMTIYNFAQMTKNIGTFTAAGVGLEESAAAIKGIANLAAASGSTSQQASTAMYQLSQALAAGRVSLMDWNSVVNAGMGGELFQEALKRTSRAMGTGVDEAIKKYGTFRESLTQGGWLTKEVLTETLSQIAGAYDEAELRAQGYNETQIKEILELAETATNAATKVKTFTQLWDTMKEAAQSGWAQTWELIVGDFEEAREFLTGLSDLFNGIIGESANNRNTMLEGALTSNWDKLIKSLGESGISNADFTESVNKALEKHGYKVDEVVKKYGSLEKAFKSGDISSDILKEAVDGLGSSMVDLSNVTAGLSRDDGLGGYNEDVAKIQESLKALGYDLGTFGDQANGVDGIFGEMTENAIRSFQEMNGLEVTGIIDQATIDKIEELNTKTVEAKGEWQTFIDGVDQLGGRELLIEGVNNILNSLIAICGEVKKAWVDIFPPVTSEQLYNIIAKFHEFTEKLKLNQGMLNRVKIIFKGLFAVVDIVRMAFMGVVDAISPMLGGCGSLIDTITILAARLAKWIINLRDGMKETDFFTGAFAGLKSIVEAVSNAISGFADILKGGFKLPDIGGWFSESADGADGAGDKLSGFLTIIKSVWNGVIDIAKAIGGLISGLFGSIGEGIENNGFVGFIDIVKSIISGGFLVALINFMNNLSKSAKSLVSPLSGLKSTFKGLKEFLEAKEGTEKAKQLLIIAGAIGILAVALLLISSIDEDKLAGSLVAITTLCADLMGSMALFNKIGNPVDTIKAVGFMVGMSVAVLILATALKKISSLDWDELAKGILGVTALMAVMVAAVKVMSKGGKTIIKGAGQLILIAAAVKILASACKDLAQLKWSELAKGLAGIGAILLEMAIFSKIAKGAKGLVSMGVGMIAIGAAMKIFASAIADFGAMEWSDIGKGLVAIAGALIAVGVAMKLMPKGMLVTGIGLIAVATALIILTNAMGNIADMSWENIAKGLVAIAGAMLVLAVGLHAMTGTVGGAAALLVASLALAVMAPTLMSLGSMKWSSIAKGLIVLAGAFAVIGIAGLLLKPLIPAILGLAGAFAIIGVGAVLIGAGLIAIGAGLTAIAIGITSLIAALTGSVAGIVTVVLDIITSVCRAVIEAAPLLGEAVKAIVLMLVDVLITCVPVIVEGAMQLLVGLLDGLIQYGPQIVTKLFDFIIVIINALGEKIPDLIVAVMDFIGKIIQGVLDAIGGLSFDSVVNALLGVGLLAALVGVIALISPLIPAAMTGILGLSAVAAELIIMLTALGGIAQIPGLTWLIDEGGTLLQSIGEALGGFVGGIVGGFAEGVSDSFPAIGTNLSTFMTNVQPFIDGAKGVDQTAVDGVANLASMILQITAADIINGITGFFTGESSLESFGTELANFGTALKTYSDNVAGIDTAAITASAQASMWLAVLANNLPNCGGLVSFFTGSTMTMTEFGEQIVPFGTALKDFSTEVTGVDTAAITAAATAGSSLATLASQLPNCGGLVSFLAGDTMTMSEFGAELIPFGAAIKGFSVMVTGLNVEAVTAAASAAESLVTLANNLPNCGGLMSFFTGSTMTMTEFGLQLLPFGSAIKGFSVMVDGINVEAITAAASAGESLATLASNLPNCGGLMSFFTGSTMSMTEFGLQLLPFGSAIKGFSVMVDGINIDAVTAAATAGESLATLASNLPNCGGLVSFIKGDTMSMADFGMQLLLFGSGIRGFSTMVTGIDTAAVTAAATASESLVALANNLPNCGGLLSFFTGSTMTMADFGLQLLSFGSGIRGFSSMVTGIDTVAISAAATAGESLATLAGHLPNCGGLVTFFTGDTMTMSEFGTSLKDFGTGIKDFATEVTGIDTAAVTAAATAGESLATLATNLPESGGLFSVFTGDTDMAEFGKQLKDFGTGIKDFGTEVAGINPETVTAAANAGQVLAGVANALPDDGGVTGWWTGDKDISGFGTQLKEFGTGIKDFYAEVSGVDSDILSNIITNVESLNTMIGNLATLDTSGVSTFTDAIEDLGEVSVSDLITAFDTAGVDLSTAVNTMILDGLNEITLNSTLFTESGRLMATWICNGFDENSVNISTSFSTIITNILGDIATKFPMFNTAGNMLMTYFGLGIQLGSLTAVTSATSAVNSCISAINLGYTGFYNAGRDLVKGFANGITDNAWRATAKAKAMAESALTAAKEALGIKSPSREFFEAGGYVAMGMAQGIDSLSGLVEESSETMANKALKSTASVISKLGDAINSDLDTQPTIRPVLDLTDVESKAGLINSIFGATDVGSISFMMNRQLQNGKNDDVVSALDNLTKKIDTLEKPTYNVNGVTYDDGSQISAAVETLVRAVVMEGRS